MSNPYVGEIRQVGFNFAPVGWLLCTGQTVPITQYEMLYALIGTTYGGDGQSNFGLPNLAGRMPVHMGTASSGTTYVLGGTGGMEDVTVTPAQIPAHSHVLNCSSATPATSPLPANNLWAPTTPKVFATVAPTVAMNNGAITPTGGSQPHDNMPPFQAVNFIIAYAGIFPSQS